MKRIKIKLGANSHEVNIGLGSLAQTGHWLIENGFTGKLVIITNSTVKRLYGDALKKNLNAEGFETTVLPVPDGEDQKSLETASRLYNELTDCYTERTTPILALGGGVIGDLAGFVAATYLRGVPFIQLPTTLLAQVDSSIGGKVAVNHGQLKNIIGAFYQPGLVVTDISALKTLPTRELTNGLAEVIKSAVIWEREFFTFLESNLEKVQSLDDEVLEEVVFRSVKIKAEVVEKDEKESGLRSILNYGHTIGHAIETILNFELRHGEAVAIGMIASARISNEIGILAKSELTRLENVIKRAGLPTEMPDLIGERVIQVIKHDKKVLRGKVRFILLKSIGDVFISDEVNPSLIKQV
jgi:3-dehydroquinate synthase